MAFFEPLVGFLNGKEIIQKRSLHELSVPPVAGLMIHSAILNK
jgi:hypothetical protein